MTIAESLIQKGKIEGLKEGEEKGKIEGKIEAAKNLLHILDDETISKTLSIPLDQVKQLRQNDTL